MLALIFALSSLENALPPLPFLPPGVKPGLSNIMVMYCAFFFRKREAFLLAFLKSGFVLLTRGAIAGIMSFAGGMISVSIITLLLALFGERISVAAVSVSGALAHNFGQLAASSLILANTYTFWYFPVLAVSGVLFGIVTGITLKALTPALGRVLRDKDV
jgi:heptaprenyl diphosphate synthase